MKRALCTFILTLLALAPISGASPPGILNHQGRIAVGGVNFDGTGHFKFALVDGAGTTSFWSNDGTSIGGSEPTASIAVAVSKGHYSVALGETGAIPASVFADNDDVRLRVWFSQTGGAGSFEHLAPDRRLASAGYALSAATAGGVSEGAITSTMLADGSITGDKLAAGSVTGTHIAAGAVGSAQLLDGAVATSDLSDGAVTIDQLSTTPTGVSLEVTINNPDPDEDDFFGSSVAAVGTDKLLIGAYRDDTGALNAGSAYLYDTGGTLLATINNPDLGDEFGQSVAAVGTDRLLIGAFRDDTGADDAGSAYLYDTGGTLLATINNPTPDTNDFFGISVAAVGADKLLIGASRDNTGADSAGSVYLYDTGGTLLATINNPTPDAFDFFGGSVAAVGADKLLIGADGDDTGANSAGSAYLYDTAGTLLTTINNPDPDEADGFGGSVAAVGADKLLIGADGDDTGANSAGSAYLYDTAGTLLAIINNPDPGSGDNFGGSVAAVGADKLLIGAFRDDTGAVDAGSAYLYDTGGMLLATINNPDPGSVDWFGSSVAAVGDRLLVGAYRDDTNAVDAGSAYLYELSGLFVPGLLSEGVTDGAITTTGILDGTITALDLAAGSVTTGKIAAGSVGSDEIADGAITGVDIAAASIGASELASNSVGAAEIAAGAVRSSEIADGSVTGSDMASGLSLTVAQLNIGEFNGNHEIYFYDAGNPSERSLIWNDSENRFVFDSGLALSGPINAGSGGDNMNRSYNAFSNTSTAVPSSGQITTSGDVYIRSDLEVGGTIYGNVAPPSDRNIKEHFEAVDPREILERVAELPLTTWQYKDRHEQGEVAPRHLGPMAQDFHAAFRLGSNERYICSVDADGVALAAIQALKAENDALKKQNAAILERLAQIEAALAGNRDR